MTEELPTMHREPPQRSHAAASPKLLEEAAARQTIRLAARLLLLTVIVWPLAPGLHASGAQIVRDRYGVPHIYAPTGPELFRAWGRALAEDRLWQLEVTRATVWGRAAELFGAGPRGRYLEYDRITRLTYVPEDEILRQIRALPRRHKSLLSAFTAGINDAITAALAAPDHLLPYEFHYYDVVPRLWTEADVAQVWVGTMGVRYNDPSSEIELAGWYAYLVSLHGSSDAQQMFDDLLPLDVPDSPVTCSEPGMAAAAGAPPMPRVLGLPTGIERVARRQQQRREQVVSVLNDLGQPAKPGSHMWMAGGSATSGKVGLLAGGPQMGFTVPGYLHEVGLHGGGFNLVGTTPAGYPAVLFGYNSSIAWSSTAGMGNGVDIFTLQLVGDDYHYLHDGQLLEMEKRTEIIQVRNGSPVSLDVYRSVYGPVFDWEGDLAYTQQRAWEGLALKSWAGWVDANRATTFDSFVTAASSVALSVNWGYADGTGAIGFVHCGRYPIRHPLVDVRLPTPGTGEYDWQGYRPASWNPRCTTRDVGYLANWNNRPSPTYPIGDLTAGHHWNSYQRVIPLFQALSARPRLTFSSFLEINEEISMKVGGAAFFVPRLLDWMGTDLNPRLQEAASWLAAWDKSYADDDRNGFYDDPGQAIWDRWRQTAISAAFLDEFGDYTGDKTSLLNLLLHVLEGEGSAVPLSRDYLNAVPPDQVLRQSLESALLDLEGEYGSPDMSTWLIPVAVHRFRTSNYRNIPQAIIPVRDLRLKMDRGTEDHIVILQGSRVWGVNVNPPGESGFVSPDGMPSEHYADQLDLFEDFAGYKAMPLQHAP